jgi:archaellum component FlaC
MSNAYQTVNLYAGMPGKWLNVGATGGGGGDSAGLTTVSNHLNAISTNVITISTNLNILSNNLTTISNNLNTVSNSTGTNTTNITTLSNNLNTVSNSTGTNTTNITTLSNNLNTVSNSTGTNTTNITTLSNNLNTVSNSTGTNTTNITTLSNNLNTVSNSTGTNTTNITTISNNLNTVSNTVAAGRFPSISTTTISTNLLRAGYISSPQGYISSLVVDSLAFSFSNSFIVMGDIITTSVSTIQTFTSTLTTNNLRVGTVSSLSFISFPGLQQGYAQTAIAEQSTGTGLQELLVFRGSSASDRIRMQTTGSIVFEPGVGARVFPAAPSNATPAMIINASSNVGIGIAAPTVTLDVAGTGRFQILSTQQIYVSSISSGSVYGKFFGDGSSLTGLPSGGLPISTNNTTLTDPASIIIKTPNTSYFYEDYTNLTNYITISNYGAQNGDYINIVNTGNSGAPATFQVLDGSTGVSSIIRYIYPGHAGVVAYSSSQWWPL